MHFLMGEVVLVLGFANSASDVLLEGIEGLRCRQFAQNQLTSD